MTEMVVAHHRSVGLPSEDEAARYYRLADKVARTEMVPGDLRGKPDMVLATMLAGRELGLGPLESCRVFYVVDGKPSESAELLHTLALRAGHDIYVAESTRDRCVVHAKHRDWPENRKHREIIFDVEDAGTAELVSYVCADSWPRHQTEQVQKSGRNGNYTVTACVADDRGVRCKDNYRKYARAMFRSRAITEAVRSVCPEVTVGATYTAEELGAEVAGEHGTPAGRDERQWSQPLDNPPAGMDDTCDGCGQRHGPHDPECEGQDVVDAEIVEDDEPEDVMPCEATPPGRDYPTCELAEVHDGDHEAGRAHWRTPDAGAPVDEPEAAPPDVCDICGKPEDGHTHDETAQEGGADARGATDASKGQPPAEPTGGAGDDSQSGVSSPAPNPCKTCGPEPRDQPCPDCPDGDPKTLAERARAKSEGNTEREAQRERINAAFRRLAADSHDSYKGLWERLGKIVGGHPNEVSWDGCSVSRLKSLADDAERLVGKLVDA